MMKVYLFFSCQDYLCHFMGCLMKRVSVALMWLFLFYRNEDSELYRS
ncbi:hypothetical protein BN440_2033 [Erwinia amylovora MR1]|nr:hypothetical protein BN440_2033 [Erwinia amylovora MR1]